MEIRLSLTTLSFSRRLFRICQAPRSACRGRAVASRSRSRSHGQAMRRKERKEGVEIQLPDPSPPFMAHVVDVVKLLGYNLRLNASACHELCTNFAFFKLVMQMVVAACRSGDKLRSPSTCKSLSFRSLGTSSSQEQRCQRSIERHDPEQVFNTTKEICKLICALPQRMNQNATHKT